MKLIIVKPIIIVAIVVVAGLGINQAFSSSGGSSLQDQPTRVQKGIMSAQQKEHSKLYGEYSTGLKSIPEQLSGMPGVLIKVGPPWEGSTRNPSPISLASFLRELACAADAVVIGRVKSSSSQMTESEDFVFTDYEVTVDEVLKDYASDRIIPRTEIVVTRPGGRIQIEGKVVETVDVSFKPLIEGGRHLLFLHRIPTTRAYKAVSSLGSFELGDQRVSKLTEQTLRVDREIEDVTSFVIQVRASIAGIAVRTERF
ncbi:MAG: hypothetical protein AABO41_10750 [Acidobacteriota bacterium]